MALSLAELSQIVRAVLRGSAVELAPTTRFDDIPGWDPMDLISVVVEVECRCSLMFEPREIDTLHTVGDLLRLTAVKHAPTAG